MSRRFGSPAPLTASEVAMRKKRRYQSLSDEEIQQEMDQRGLSYRYGWPELPPLPVRTMTKGAQNAVEGAVARLEDVQSILRLQRIQFYNVFFAYRIPRALKIDADEELDGYHTLVITADTTRPDMFIQALTRIRHSFKIQKPTENVSIEIIDYRAVEDLFTFPIRPADKLIQDSWSAVSTMVHSEILAHSEDWLCIEAAHRGVVETRCTPTIIITTPTAESEVWAQKIMPKVRIQLRNFKPLYDLEVLYGIDLLGSQGSETITINSYDDRISMGASIGIPGEPKHAGTMGGIVRLSDNQMYGITNHHVVRNARIDELLNKSGETTLRPGNDSLKAEPHILKSPADCDHAGFLNRLDSQDAIWQTQKMKGNLHADSELQKNEAFRNAAKSNPRTLGTLFASSGPSIVKSTEFTTRSKSAPPNQGTAREFLFLLDWGLIEITPPRMVRNELARGDFQLDGATTQLVKGQLCNSWAPLNVGKTHIKREEVEVAKCGRTTGWTFGTISSILTMINPAHDPTFKEMAKTYGLTGASPGYCYSVIKRGRRNFVQPGDSGSVIVHDPTGTWVGLLFGESAAASGLMISMAMVIDNIESVTGSVVVEPKRDDMMASAS